MLELPSLTGRRLVSCCNVLRAMIPTTRFVSIVCVLLLIDIVLISGVEYVFKRYSYKKKRDDRRYKHAKERCERSGMCEQRYSVDFIKCLRTCMSEKCYDELYGHDELEEGEVDVRLNSFKGCLYQQPLPDM